MFSKFFIERPVLANVMALFFILIGAVALYTLPVAQYPQITPPTVQVTTRYPGATARVLIDTVALPIEQQVNGVEGMLYMQSTSASDGTYSLIVTFEVGTDLDFAQVLVQNRVAIALPSLPPEVQKQGVITKKKSTAILQIVTLSSPDNRYDSLFLRNYATINLKDAVARLPGVGDVNVFGAGDYSMRVWLDPEKLQARGLTPKDVIDAINQQNQQVAAGQVGMPPAPTGQNFQYTVSVLGRLTDAQQFADIVVKIEQGNGGRITRIKDIGRVELGAQTYSQFFQYDGKQAAGLAIFQLPEANAIEVAQEVKSAMATMSKSFPPGISYAVPFDTTRFVDASIHEVYLTLIEAAVLVLIVIMVFLQDWRAMLVPATTVPVTIIGAFAAMAALGFTVNLLTLFALVLAIGIVVDDAIVVVEGAAHHIEEGLSPKDATIKAMGELFGPIVGITLVLMAVFLPAAFLPGVTGQLYRQFALVIAATAFISAINAVTLKPTQCALWLRGKSKKQSRFSRIFERIYGPAERTFVCVVERLVRRSVLTAIFAFGLMAASIYGLTRLPTAFLPTEDQGYLLVGLQLPDGASLERTQRTIDGINKIVSTVPGVDHVINIGGVSLLDGNATLANGGVTYVILKDWSVRGAGQHLLTIYNTLRDKFDNLPDGIAFVLPPPPIQGLGLAGGFQMEVQITDNSYDFAKLQRVTDTMLAAGRAQSSIRAMMSSFRAGAPQLYADVDRIKAQTLGVPLGDVFSTLQAYLGSAFVNQFNKFGHTFQVYVQADHRFRLEPSDVERLYVRNTKGDMVPIGTLADLHFVTGPSIISLYNLQPAAGINGTAAQGFSSGQALALMEQMAERTLPHGLSFQWTGVSFQEKLVGNQAYMIFALAIVLVYMALAGQYESWTAPVAVILGVPLMLIGVVGVLSALGVANNLYVQIGLVLLIALSSKNAILIVEYARDLRLKKGVAIEEAAIEAARRRFRPIVMTSFAFILGVLPLVLATGAGASARKSIGITVFSGMLASTCIAILFVPSFFVLLQRYSEWRGRRKHPPAPADAAPQG
jgi:hydrophobic/amphiphilic exporter-1 (mainly G- bacteria), HAE1 family